ncbi:MAG TPA: GNAT family N-acetyltransferase [Gemmatimonadales bacterium]|nr:GNAT family N-acetyltransferase [Gemmatimonadales bacterium]
MRPELTVRTLPESEYPVWNDLVAKAPEGSIYSTPEYLAALCEATGGRFRVLVAQRHDEIVGGVALYEERRRGGTVVSPRLLLYYNGPVLRPYATKYPSQRTSRHVETLAALAGALDAGPYARVRLKPRAALADVRAFQQRGWRVALSYSYVVPLHDLAAQRERVEQNLRRLIDRCSRQGICFTDDDDFDSFFAMHLQLHERKGAPLYLPKPAFERWFRRLHAAGLARLFQARLPEGRSIAAQITLLGGHPVTHTAAAAADGEFLNLGASAFLRWRAFERLAELGYRGNDLTDAALNPVTHFKSQFGGELQLALEVQRPESTTLRTAEAVERHWRRARRLAGRAARTLLRRPR